MKSSIGKIAQISVFEILMLVLLFTSTMTYFEFSFNSPKQDYKLQIDSFLDTLYYNGDYRNLIMDENLSVLTPTQNWSNVSILLNKSFSKYELIISNNSVQKDIFSCSANYGKYYVERIIAIKNNTDFQFRKIKLGVCY